MFLIERTRSKQAYIGMKRSRLLLACALILTGLCLSRLYSKPVLSNTEDVSTISEEYVRATQGGTLDQPAVIPGKVYHPRDGYISYERLWCLDEVKGSMADYIELMQEICELKNGTMKREWCVSRKDDLPLFSVSIEQNGTTCTGGDPTTIIHILEPIASYTSSEWLAIAESFGYRKTNNGATSYPTQQAVSGRQ